MKKLLILLFIFISINLYALDGTYDWSMPAKRIYPGILLTSLALENPYVNVYCVRIDLKCGFKFYTTPALTEDEKYEPNNRETWKETTRDFMRNFQTKKRLMLVAINGDFFRPWPPKNAHDPAWLESMAVSEGKLVSPGDGHPCFLWKKDGSVSLEPCGENYDISNVVCAVGGSHIILSEGKYTFGENSPYPRTIVGLSKDKSYVYWMVVDGRRHRSVGMTHEECANMIKYFGAYEAMNFDGGGSVTMCYWDKFSNDYDKCKLVNEPNQGDYRKDTQENEDAKFKVGERKVANNLGVYIDLK